MESAGPPRETSNEALLYMRWVPSWFQSEQTLSLPHSQLKEALIQLRSPRLTLCGAPHARSTCAWGTEPGPCRAHGPGCWPASRPARARARRSRPPRATAR